MQLASYIREDLKRRIQSGDALPCKLTLPGLAKYYDVSVTPIRTAIAELAAKGLVRKQANGRLKVVHLATKRRSHTPSKAIRPPRTSQDWDRMLVNEVVIASLERNAVYLREETLAQKYDTGRSVIRQSLGRLAGAGLIEHVARCGWRVHPIQADDLGAYLEIREVLELKALDLAKPHLERHALEQMLANNQMTSRNHPPQLDNRLHQYLIEKSHNRYIQSFFHKYTAAYYTAVFEYAAPEAHVVAEMAHQHRQILQALIAGHWAKAQKILSDHIWEQRPILKKLLDATRAQRKETC